MKQTNEFKCKIYHYNYDISKKEEKQQYNKLITDAKIKSKWNKPNTTHWINFPDYTKHKEFTDKIKSFNYVTIETKYLFNNQFNTKENIRMYNWHEWEYQNKDIKKGYYIDIPQKYLNLLDTTFKCGFCGKMYTKEQHKTLSFCDACLDSEYLSLDNLPLLRLKAINDKTERLPLNDCDKLTLEAAYKESQIFGNKRRGKERLKKLKESIKKDYDEAINKAETEYKGKMWLLKNKINIDNMIYYDHKKTFCFGWRNKLSFEVEQELKSILENNKNKFPYTFELKT